MITSYKLLLVFILLPTILFGQGEQPTQNVETTLPWVSAVTAGFSIWPSSKERLRIGYSWELQEKRHLFHELTYVNAGQSLILPNANYGNLQGVQLRNEMRFYQAYNKRSVLYYGLGIAYMYGKHRYSYRECFNCDANGNCASYSDYAYSVPTHTGTLMASVGLVVAANSWFHVDFFSGLGLRGTYFPVIRTDGYFGKNRVLASSETTVLEPHVRLGLNLVFVLQSREQSAQSLQKL